MDTADDMESESITISDFLFDENSDIIVPEGETMNTLPRHEEAVIPIEKFTKYALDPINSKGKHVAFQEALGYDLENVNRLIANIRYNLSEFPAEEKGDSGFGETYSVLMELTGPNGKNANVLTSWIDDKDTGQMRLTSAYVKKRKGEK